MAVNTAVPTQLQGFKDEIQKNGLVPGEGTEAFKRILAFPDSQTLVSPVDYQWLFDISWKTPGLAGDQPGEPGESAAIDQATEPGNRSTRPDLPSKYIPPSNEIEKQLVAIWQNLIGVEPIGIQDNFFELGGHSLMATQILARIRDLYQVEMPLRILFEANTIEALSKQISAMRWIANNQAPTEAASEDREEFSL